jgi:transposase
MSNLRKIKRAGRAMPTSAAPSAAPRGEEPLELDARELEAILTRAKTALSEEEYGKLHAAIETLVFLTGELEKKHVSIQKLKHLLFGAPTESTRKVIQKLLEEAGSESPVGADEHPSSDAAPPEKAKGHGRHGAADYIGAEKIRVPHAALKPGDPCPTCQKGTVYESVAPAPLVRVRGQAPLGATVYELQKLRCNLCGAIFTATPPPEVGPEKYDAASASMIALLKYGTGMPFNRLERLQGDVGLPLPAATQWDIVEETGDQIEPALEELIRQAAQGQIFHNDDTGMKILTRMDSARAATAAEPSERQSVSTSGILSILDGHRIALFFTGHRNAGENLTLVLQQRATTLDRPIHMCDALPQNLPDLPPELQTLLAHCLTHARRHFVEVVVNFPDECLYVLQALKIVYTNDALAQEQGLSAQERLAFHQAHSQATMEALNVWLTAQLDERKVEPNSGLGQAITYMLKHWEPLTLFLHQPAAPLDNNICEQALKKAILHRKNAYFYKTENGARVGDLFMSLIHTCELNGVNPLDYLTQLLQHPNELAAHPADWMPWNYRETRPRSATPQNV